MYNRALVATDGSESALGAIELAKELMLSGVVKSVILINVVENIVDWKTYSIINTKFDNEEEFNKALSKKGSKILQPGHKLFKQSGLTVDSLVRFGKPEEEIVKNAESLKCDLIIMGNRGLSKIKDIVLGSVSQKVMHLAKVGVIVYKPEATTWK
ncbi:MAG: universal stress protein [Syntrophomonadaceae bacterium]|jgi:nucleotide-binding universal stress UspA family protein